MLIFLWNWRSTIIAAVAIPTSIIATFGLIWYQGFTLNSMTLLALTLSVGIVIDDAIVVLENIYRFVEEKGTAADAGGGRGDARDRPRRAGDHAVAHRDLRAGRLHGRHRRAVHDQLRLHDVVRDPGVAARQLHADADAGGALDQDAAAARDADGHEIAERRSKDSRFFRPLDRGYTAILQWSLAHRAIVAGMAVLVLLSSVPLFMVANKNFLPNDDQSEFEVGLRAPEGTSLEATEIIANRLATRIRRLPEVAYTLVSVADDPAQTQNSGTVYVRLKPVDERRRDQFAVMNDVRANMLPELAAANLRTGVRPVATIGGGGNQNAEIQFTINGPDLKALERYRRMPWPTAAKKEPGVVDVDTSLNVGKPELSVNLDRLKAADLGVADFGRSRGAAAARRRRSGDDLQRRRRAV